MSASEAIARLEARLEAAERLGQRVSMTELSRP